MNILYLHCGYHKSGSSFLQTMFARNRGLLKKASIYYPFSNRELDMIRGEISPGNGQELSDSLISKNNDSTDLILEKGVQEAQRNKCNSLLYSNEALFHAFARENALSKLCDSASKAGFKKIKALVYFRDPVSHALSTYKHRAKRGGHSDFNEWVNHKYETMELLSKFKSYHCQYPVDWNCRKYQQDSHFMAESAFKDWLQLEVPEIPEDDKVNRSLNLSEIRFLQILKADFHDTIPFLREEFGKIEKKDNSADEDLNNVYKAIASQVLLHYGDLIESINRILPENENLVIEEFSNENICNFDDLEIKLKKEQIEGLALGFLKASDSKKIINRILDFWNRGVEKVKRHYKAAGF